jgi:transcriptional regulator with XRE-family HTH domain
MRRAVTLRNSLRGIAGRQRVRYQYAMATQAPTAGIADLIRQWRERHHVSQLELALRADTTQRHISFIERGRSHPGRGMIVRLAEALDIPLRERNSMLLAAGYAPAYPETTLEDPRLDPVRSALEQILDGHLPYPAVLTDRAADLVSGNAAFMALIADIPDSLRGPPVNLGRVLLHPEGLRPRIINLDEWGRHVIDGLRRKAARHPHARLTALIEELDGYGESRPPPPSSAHLGFAVPLRLRTGDGELTLLTTLTHFATAIDVAVSELTLEAFIPADAISAQYFSSTRASRD